MQAGWARINPAGWLTPGRPGVVSRLHEILHVSEIAIVDRARPQGPH